MRICFVSRGSLNSFWDTYGGSDADIVFFGFQGIGEVSYEKELRGETGYFEDAAILSKENHNVVVCGCVTDTRGVKRKSAVVAENGRLLGVSDMLNAIDGEYKSGAGLRVYETKVGRLGIAVAEDLYFPEICVPSPSAAAILFCARSGSSPIRRSPFFCARPRFPTAYPVGFCGAGYSQLADVSGAVAFASPDSPWNFPSIKNRNII